MTSLNGMPGETLLLSGKLLTGRDAAHKRLVTLLDNNEPLPDGINLSGRFIYYVGPVDAVRDEAVGPAGPTTATRMDAFTDTILEKTGLIGMVGKAERGPDAIESIKKHVRCILLLPAALLIWSPKPFFHPGLSLSRSWAWKQFMNSWWRHASDRGCGYTRPFRTSNRACRMASPHRRHPHQNRSNNAYIEQPRRGVIKRPLCI